MSGLIGISSSVTPATATSTAFVARRGVEWLASIVVLLSLAVEEGVASTQRPLSSAGNTLAGLSTVWLSPVVGNTTLMLRAPACHTLPQSHVPPSVATITFCPSVYSAKGGCTSGVRNTSASAATRLFASFAFLSLAFSQPLLFFSRAPPHDPLVSEPTSPPRWPGHPAAPPPPAVGPLPPSPGGARPWSSPLRLRPPLLPEAALMEACFGQRMVKESLSMAQPSSTAHGWWKFCLQEGTAQPMVAPLSPHRVHFSLAPRRT
eukprot:1030304-Prorocentrum_minimum.AAC.4